MPPDPYSRSYWRFPDEYPNVYADDAAYALWCRLRDLADMAWPSSGTLPSGVRKRALAMLTDAQERLPDGQTVASPLVYLKPGGRYRIRGMDKQREGRAESARVGANARWHREQSQSERNANGVQSQSERNAKAMHIPSQEREESERNAKALPDEEQREHLDRLRDVLADVGALPPKAVAAERQKALPEDEQLIERYQAIAGDEGEPDWKRDAAREQLSLMGVR